jgi:DNA repair photolyase
MSNYAIYQPKNKAAEYAEWACNFYVGCTGMCSYCYCKKGILGKAMGGDSPELKKCFKDEKHALDVFEKELKANLSELQEHGLFFSFTTDPMLPETIGFTFNALSLCLNNNVPVKILTKRADWWYMWYAKANIFVNKQHMVAFGFTLTGHDELEPGASINQERIEAMEKLHDAGFRTFASIEPVIDFDSSLAMIMQTAGFCDHYKIGLLSGQKVDWTFTEELDSFIYDAEYIANENGSTIYWKDSITKHINCDGKVSVGRDFNIFSTC